MELESILSLITGYCQEKTDASKVIAGATKKIGQGKATYADAQRVAIEQGEILEDAFREYLPEALESNGMLYRAAAEVVVKQPVKNQAGVISDIAEQIQAMMNEQAGLNINPIVPDLNEDQLDGIITGICNAESFAAREETLYDQVGNFMEGYVDDFVRENADFQYQAGLEPTIERRTNGKCCKWCSQLAGNYLYADVRGKGNDVWRRHKNCHCEVLYNPGNGSKRRKNVHTRQWTDSGKDDRIAFARENVQTGGYSGARKESTSREKIEHAERYYEEIRNRAPYVDANKIAKRVEGFSEDDIEEIRQHMFIREIKRDGGLKRFDPDYYQAQVWQRLTTGQPLWDTDQLMLEHERMESRIMRDTECSYEEAHEKTQKVFDWWSAFTEERKRRGQ